jgi:ferric-dicitrate binding protein FerR (iron transport regulator)
VNAGRQLLHRYLDEIASSADLEQLGTLLVQQPELADELAEASRTEAVLEYHFRERHILNAVAAELASAEPAEPAKPRRVIAFPGRRWKWCAAALVLLTTGVLIGFQVGRSVDRPVAVLSGRVLVDGIEGEQAFEGSRLEVAGDEAVVLRLADGSRAELAPLSAAVLRKHGRWTRGVVELDRGMATFQVEKGKNRFRVDTPLGSVSALDGEFCVELQPVEEEDEEPMNSPSTVLLVVAALVGQVEVDSGGQRYVLAAGEKKAFAEQGSKKPGKPDFGGTVVAVSATSLTVESPPSKKGGEATRKEFKLTDQTKYSYVNIPTDSQKPTVGFRAGVWLKESSNDTADRVQFAVKQTILDGTVVSVADDGKSFTLESPGKKQTVQTKLTIPEGAKLVYRAAEKGDKPTVGYFARVWVKFGTTDTASGVVFSSKKITDEKGNKGTKKGTKTGEDSGKKPGKETKGKKAAVLGGTVGSLGADGKSFTLEIPAKKGGQPSTIEIRLGDGAKITSGKAEAKLAVGQVVIVWLEDGSTNVAQAVQVGVKPSEGKKPGTEGKKGSPDGKKPAADGKKPAEGKKPGTDGKPTPGGKKPAADGEKPPANGKKPTPEGKKPETEGKKPATEGKKPAADGKKPTPDGKPAVEGKKPAPEGKKPAADGKPTPEGKKPAADGK